MAAAAMASAPFLRRIFISAACTIIAVFFLLSLYPTTQTSFTQSATLERTWTTVWSRPGPKIKTSQLHYLVPASLPNLQLCYNLVSSTVNRYPVPTLLGWNGTGPFDAAQTHLAKLRAIQRYLHLLPLHENDDLVLIVDGYDIIHQLPAEIIIERYFDIANKADAHLAARFNTSKAEAHRRNLRQTIFWGPDKICFPFDPRASRCWAAPASPLDPHAFGPLEGNGDMVFNDPRWLNSGTVIGPIADMRRFIDAAIDEIAATFDDNFELRNSDQFYVANVWARQEYWRAKLAAHGAEVPGGPEDRIIPDKRADTQDTELHATIEYESAIFQTKAGYEPFLGRLQFGQGRLKAMVDVDVLNKGPDFRPYSISMPSNVRAALTKLYSAIPEAHDGTTVQQWLRSVSLGVNFVTKHIYGLWHCTGPKDSFDAEYQLQWWFPFTASLLRAAVKSSLAGDLISERPIDGRRWAAKTVYPASEASGNEYGGAWSDADGGRFIPWADLCAAHQETLFRGERDRAAPAPAPLVKRTRPQRQWR
ncbi:hypothetical protein CDD83_7781 [Cordyceps sp. RAO-2017]|nr:hypothetical protein CDD83_7781 [Cordyceps sp. RAO-2017]